ncbi:Rho-type GTPase activating protein Rga1 [Rhizina undulata]
MSPPSDGPPSQQLTQPLPQLTTTLSNTSNSSVQQSNRSNVDRSPVSPGGGLEEIGTGGGAVGIATTEVEDVGKGAAAGGGGETGGRGSGGGGGVLAGGASSGISSRAHKTCHKCQGPLTGQFVRALGGTFHLDCFKCRDCGVIVASKFFPVDDENGGQYPLCETDYFRRLDLLCHECGGALRGSYITALERKYHIEHFTCCVCPTVFGPQDSYYEHDGRVYCHYHYSTQFAAKCNGCQTAILKQFVEIFRNGQNQHWHPECYMIHKFWCVRMAPIDSGVPRSPTVEDPTNARRSLVREAEEKMEDRVYRIWSVLSSFEESSAACISDMLLHVSNGAYVDGVFVAEKFIWHVEILFGSADNLDAQFTQVAEKGLNYSREAKLLCKKIVAFFSLLSKTQETGVRKLGVTQELLSLVTGLAHYLKLLIRISLQGALRLERDHNNTEALRLFLEEVADLEAAKEAKQSLEATQGMSQNLADQHSDLCFNCRSTIEDECAKLDKRRWHVNCLTCSSCKRELKASLSEAMWSDQEQRVYCSTCAQNAPDAQGGFTHITRLKQYVYLLRVALARLLVMLKQGGTLPHTSDDPNLQNYDSSEGHKLTVLEPPLLRSDTRSKSYGGEQTEAYTNTINDIRRLRSTRLLDRQVGSSAKKRQSRLVEGPQVDSVRPESAGASTGQGADRRRETGQFRMVEDKDVNGEPVEHPFGLTLDDIPRIVAVEQAREQRPNHYKHQRPNNYGANAPNQPRLINGHQREVTTDKLGGDPSPSSRTKRYFSELSAIDYFIVRHIAVLSMEPLVEGHFNLEELLGLIETNKKTFWGKFGKAFQPADKKKATKKKGLIAAVRKVMENKKLTKTGVFGIPLDVLVERDGAESSMGVGPGTLRIPAIIDDAVVAMRQMDMSVEGVFRKNGNIRKLKDLAENIDRGETQVDMSGEGPVQIAALLKKFLRDLPDPLLTFKLHRLFVTSQKIQDEEKKRRVLHLTCCLLPKSHRDAMEILFTFLNWTASFSHIDEDTGSKMDVHNLSTVITPNILYSKSKEAGMDDSFLAIEAVHTLIECNEAMCEVPEDLLSILNDSNLFAHGADVTTKDILKRYGEVMNKSVGRTPQTVSSPPRSKDGRPTTTPIFHRVDGDPTQNVAWQKGTMVPHVPGPPQALQPPINPNDNNSNQNNNEHRGHARGNSGSSDNYDNGTSASNGHDNSNGQNIQSNQNGHNNQGNPPNPPLNPQNGPNGPNGPNDHRNSQWVRQPSQRSQHNRAEHNRAEHNRAEHNRAEQNRAELNRTEHSQQPTMSVTGAD